jgi:hypothetical protein
MLKMSEIRLIRAPFLFWINLSIPENPVKPPFSVPVENEPNNRSVCQNTADLHLNLVACKALYIEAVFSI